MINEALNTHKGISSIYDRVTFPFFNTQGVLKIFESPISKKDTDFRILKVKAII